MAVESKKERSDVSLLRPDFRPRLAENLLQGARKLHAASLSAPLRSVGSGTVLIRPDRPSDGLFHLYRGWATRTRYWTDGRRAILSIYVPGDVIGIESALLDRAPDEVVTVSPAMIHTIDAGTVANLMTSPPTATYIAWLISEAQRRGDGVAGAIGRLDARERLALMLLDFHERLRRRNLASPSSYVLPLTQQHIADHLGLTIVHINRTLHWFRAERIVDIEKHIVTIRDLDRLRQIAMADRALGGAARRTA